jgi:hypothetical protein
MTNMMNTKCLVGFLSLVLQLSSVLEAFSISHSTIRHNVAGPLFRNKFLTFRPVAYSRNDNVLPSSGTLLRLNFHHLTKCKTDDFCDDLPEFGSRLSTFPTLSDGTTQFLDTTEFTKSSASGLEKEVGGYDPSERLRGREVNVGDPQRKLQEKEFSVTSILRELAAIQQKGPQKYCILGTRHCSYLHQQIIELL